MADIFDVIADGTRRELLQHLRDHGGEVSVTELVTQLGVSQPTVSKHLKVLRDHDLVAVRDEGQHRYYRLDAGPLGELETWLAPFLAGRTEVTAASAITPPVFVAWAGTEVAERMGRAAADTANTARVALDAAQEKLQGAQKRVAGRLPRFGRDA
ncbi:MAG TPA: metalloregulator ArsR/SmtB family transcription factor [Pseudolysinimonas sp.]|nr:metalloregulator ArsR/SmtB family transcription factor [Pseudolysinimonas sp.]